MLGGRLQLTDGTKAKRKVKSGQGDKGDRYSDCAPRITQTSRPVVIRVDESGDEDDVARRAIARCYPKDSSTWGRRAVILTGTSQSRFKGTPSRHQ